MSNNLVEDFLRGQQLEMDLINSAQRNAIDKALAQVQLKSEYNKALEQEQLAQPRYDSKVAALNYDKTRFDNAALTSNALVNPRIEEALSDINLKQVGNQEKLRDIEALSELDRARRVQEADTGLKRSVLDNTIITMSGDDIVRQGVSANKANAYDAGIRSIDSETSLNTARDNLELIQAGKSDKLKADLGLGQVAYRDAGVAIAADDLEREVALSNLGPEAVKDYLQGIRNDGVSGADRKLAAQGLLDSIQEQESELEKQHYVNQIITDPVKVAQALGVRIAPSGDGALEILDSSGTPVQKVDANGLRLMLANRLGVETETYKTLLQEEGKNNRAAQRAESSSADLIEVLGRLN